jgi:serine/threonine protein kinase
MSYCLNPNCPKPQNPDNTNFCQSCGSKILLNERYRSIKLIGQGGFGKTFLAVDEHKPSKPKCVIKQFFPQAQGTNNSQKAAELFEQEAVRLDELGKHPQIPELLAHFSQDNHQYLIQEFIDGQNLAQILEAEGTFKESQIRELLNSLLPVLEFIHSHNVIHRDIKPENIIRRPDGQLVLVDFGAAKFATVTALLKTGTVIGTPEYIAPEQARGKTVFASDLYSLGVTCIHLLTQVSPFDLFDINEDAWIWRQYLINNSVSQELGKILDKMVQISVKERCKTVNELMEALKLEGGTNNKHNLHPSMVGIWYGEFGSENKPSTLVITSNVNDTFMGKLAVRERNGKIYEIEIKGEHNRKTNEVSMLETKIISDPLGWWKLGKNNGKLYHNQQQLSGIGGDARGSYSWSFSKSTSLIGKWYGEFGKKSSILNISSHEVDNSFSGTLIAKAWLVTFKISIRGQINLRTNEITIQETKILEDPFDQWTLGENKGSLSSDGKRISGVGKDKRGDSYSWSFSRGVDQ